MNPTIQYIRSVVFCSILALGLWITAGLMNGWDILLIFTFSAGSFITFLIIHLPYFLLYAGKITKIPLLLFAPFIIILLLFIYQFYNLATGNWAEMVMGKRTVIKIWQARVFETLFVLIVCMWTAKKYKARLKPS